VRVLARECTVLPFSPRLFMPVPGYDPAWDCTVDTAFDVVAVDDSEDSGAGDGPETIDAVA
jgi:hypothetical protein